MDAILVPVEVAAADRYDRLKAVFHQSVTQRNATQTLWRAIAAKNHQHLINQ